MEYLLISIAAFLLGVVVAIPAGPVQIEVVRRSLNGHLAPSLMVVFGAFLVDVAYGIVALFGIAPVLRDERVMACFWLAGGLILVALGTLVLRHSSRGEDAAAAGAGRLGRKRWGLIGGISLSVTNPAMVLWWLTGMRLFQDAGLVRELTPRTVITFLAAGSLGLAAYLSALALFLYWAKKFISPRTLRIINTVFGVFLLVVALYFIATSLHRLLWS